jgi:erythromycin esterase-like protein
VSEPQRGVVEMLRELLERRLELLTSTRKGNEGEDGDGKAFFDAEMNARLVRDSERYYRAMYYDGWNGSLG